MISLFALASTARADQVRSAVSVLTPPTPCSPAYSFDRTIDQSGLSVGYTSGVTDFATYIGANPRHIASNGPPNFSCTFDTSRTVDYDLGAAFTIKQLAFWQYPFAQAGPIINFQVFTSNNAGFVGATLVGSFTALIDGTGTGGFGTGAQVFTLTNSDARYLRMNVLSIDPGSTGYGWSEVAFDAGIVGTTVPEPATLLMTAIGLVGAVVARRRQRS